MAKTVNVFRTHKDAKIPARGSSGAAGYDLYSCTSLSVKPGECVEVPIGIRIEVPNDCLVRMYSRSGIASNYLVEITGVDICPGEVGDVKLKIRNNGEVPFDIHVGDRIGQMVFIKLYAGELTESDSLSDTVRGDAGLGSTGKN